MGCFRRDAVDEHVGVYEGWKLGVYVGPCVGLPVGRSIGERAWGSFLIARTIRRSDRVYTGPFALQGAIFLAVWDSGG